MGWFSSDEDQKLASDMTDDELSTELADVCKYEGTALGVMAEVLRRVLASTRHTDKGTED